MARKKVTLAYLNNQTERKASLRKRQKGMMKKVEELSTLCGVEACAVTYNEFQPHPEVWPSPAEARRTLERFMEIPEMEKSRYMENHMSFTQQRTEKTRNKVRRLQRENKRKELTIFMFNCIEGNANVGDFDIRDTGEMNVVLNEVLNDITERMDRLRVSAGVAAVDAEKAADGEGPSAAADAEKATDGEGPSAAAAATTTTTTTTTEDVAAQLAGGFLDENENPTGFSYWDMLMSPLDDFGWNTEAALSLPPHDAASAPGPSRPPSD